MDKPSLCNPLPCPFCGSDARLFDQLSQQSFVECKKCGASGPDVHGPDNKQKAIEGWNKRV